MLLHEFLIGMPKIFYISLLRIAKTLSSSKKWLYDIFPHDILHISRAKNQDQFRQMPLEMMDGQLVSRWKSCTLYGAVIFWLLQ